MPVRHVSIRFIFILRFPACLMVQGPSKFYCPNYMILSCPSHCPLFDDPKDIRRDVQHLIMRFDETWNFLDRFSKNPQISNLMKIRPMGAEMFHAVGRTHDEANSRFSQFWERM